MKKVISFDNVVDFDYLEMHYGVTIEQVPESGIYSIYCNYQDGSTGQVGLIGTGNELTLYPFESKVTESFDGLGYEMEFESKDSIVYYKVEV